MITQRVPGVMVSLAVLYAHQGLMTCWESRYPSPIDGNTFHLAQLVAKQLQSKVGNFYKLIYYLPK